MITRLVEKLIYTPLSKMKKLNFIFPAAASLLVCACTSEKAAIETPAAPAAEAVSNEYKPMVHEAGENEMAFVTISTDKIDEAVAELRAGLKDLPKGTACLTYLEEINGGPLVASFAVPADANWLGFIPFPGCDYILQGGVLKTEEGGDFHYAIDVKIIRRGNNLDVEHVENLVSAGKDESFVFPLSAMQAESMADGKPIRVFKYAVLFSAGEK